MAYQVAYEVAYQVAQSNGPVVAQSGTSRGDKSGTSQLLVQRGLTPTMGGVAGGVANARCWRRRESTNDRERQTDTAQATRAEGR